MDEAAERQEYEQAAKLRDQLAAARRAMETQEMVLTQPEDLDVIGLAEDDLEAAFQVFFVRGGRVIGRKGWVVDRVEELNRAELVGVVRPSALHGARRGAAARPRPRAPGGPRGPGAVARPAPELRSDRACPERGAKRKLLEVVTRNAAEAFHRHKLRRASDFGARSRALSRARRAARSASRRRCGSSATTSRTWGRPTRWARWWCSRTGCPSAATIGGSRSRACPDRTISPAWRRCSGGGSRGSDPGSADEPGRGHAAPVLLPAGARRGRRRTGPARRRAARCWPTSGLTSRTSASRSASRRSTSPAGPSRCSSREAPRRCSCCSTSATRRTGSRSRTTARSGRSARSPRRSTRSPAWGRRARRRCSSGSVRSPGCATPRWTRSPPRRGSGPSSRRDPRAPASARRERRGRGREPSGLSAEPDADEPCERRRARSGRRAAAASRARRSRSSPGSRVRADPRPRSCLEDLGYFVVDNLPPALLGKMAELASRPGGPARVAIVVDARGGVFFGELSKALEELKQRAHRLPDPLPGGRRRRPGEPVRGDAPPSSAGSGGSRGRGHPQGATDDGEPARRRGPHHRHVRTSRRTSCASGSARRSPRRRPRHGLQVALISFGFKYGAPRDADLVLDVRFLPNPYWVAELRPLPGSDEAVRTYVKGQQQYREFIERLEALLDVIVPGTWPRARPTSRSRSAAPAAGTARSWSPRSSRAFLPRARHPGRGRAPRPRRGNGG